MASEKIDALELDITSKTSTENVDKLIDSLSRLSTELGKIKSKKVSVDIKQTGDASKSAATSVNKLSGSFLTQAIRITAVIALYRKLSGVISDGVANSANYIKSLNMYTVSLGEYADNATKYGETVSDALGIDIASWQKTQGIFQTLITGFGVTGDKAAYMSQNLTQLTYDIASFYGITNEEAANKLKAALSGRLEPIRKLGYDLSQSKLVDLAKNPANYGKQTFSIDKETGAIKANTVATDDNTKHKIVNFNQLTQQEKVQLRYIALMTQVTQVQGNYARALNDPASQMNVFKQQLDMTSRALGNIFIPILNKTLPYLSAFAQLTKEALQSIANLMGFELPDMKDRTDISKNVKPYNDVVKATGNAAKNAKKMKDYLLGIDELNVFNPNTGANGANSGGKNSNLKNLKVPGYDFLGKAVENSIKKAKATIKQFFDDLKKNPFLLNDIFVWGASELGANFWEGLLGKSPEQLAQDAANMGISLEEAMVLAFTDAFANKSADIIGLLVGKTPEQLGEEAASRGMTISEYLIDGFTQKCQALGFNSTSGDQLLLDMLFGKPEDLAQRAAKTGRSVGEQFGLEAARAIIKFFDSPILSELYKILTGRDTKSDLAEINRKLAPKATTAVEINAPNVKIPNLALDGKTKGAEWVNNFASGIKSAEGKVDKASKGVLNTAINGVSNNGNSNTQFSNIANGNSSAYAESFENAYDDVWKSANKGLYQPTINGMTNNGTANSKYKATATSGVKNYTNNIGTSAQKKTVYINAVSLSNEGVSGARSKLGEFATVGANAGAGYISGINNPKNTKEAVKAGAILGANTLIQIKKTLGIESPSKEFAKVGKWSVEGYANAVTDNTKLAVNSVATMANRVLEAASRATELSNRIILNGTIADPTANRVSIPTTNNAGYGVGYANEGAMASLASNIYQAVVSGMSNANIGTSNGGDIKVIIDGKEVFKAVQTESRKRGVAISNGTFSR